MAELSPDMRRLIDDAVAAGQVQVVAPGVSALPLPVWDGTNLRYPEGAPRGAIGWKKGGGTRRARSVPSHVAARRAAFRRHWTPDITAAAMGRLLGASAQVARDDARAVDLPLAREQRGPNTGIACRRAHVAALLAGDNPPATRAALLAQVRLRFPDTTHEGLRGDRRALGHSFEPADRMRARMRTIERRRDRVADLTARRVPVRDICRLLGVSDHTVRADLDARGLCTAPTRRRRAPGKGATGKGAAS